MGHQGCWIRGHGGEIVEYVDDMLVAAEEDVMKGFMQRLQEWKTSRGEEPGSAGSEA